MANSIAKLAIMLTTDSSGMMRGFQQAKAQAKQFATQFNQSLNGASGGRGGSSRAMGGGGGGAASGIMSGLGFATNPWVLGTVALAGAVKWATQLAEETKTAAINFRVMIGDAVAAQKLLSGIKDFALNSPFQQGDLQASAQTMLAFGMANEKVLPTLKTLGDISMGNAEKLKLLTLAFSQSQAAGRLMGQDLLQMVNAGFNPLQEIARVTGRDMNDLRQAMSDGAISAQMVALAFKSATEEGGRFHEAIMAQQETMKGQWSMLMENMGSAIKPAGNAVGNFLTMSFKGWNQLFELMRTGEVLTDEMRAEFERLGKPIENTAEKLKELAGAIKLAGMELKGWDTEGIAASIERFGKLQAELGKRGDDFATKFRTPAQEFAAAIAEAAELQRDNAISAEVFARATGKAKEEFLDAERSAERIRKAMEYQGNSAISRRSGDAISEVLRAQNQVRIDAEIEKRQLEEQKKANAIQEKVLKAVERNEPVRINEVDF